MKKLVQVLNYNGNYAYSVPTIPGLIDTDDIKRAIQIPRENTRNAFDNIVRLFFTDGSHMDVIGKPEDFMEIKSTE